MSNAAVNDFEDLATPRAPPPREPQVFTRVFAVPAGAPWEQAQAAQLEARHGAPLPAAELQYRLRRLGRWSPRTAGRYAAVYVRARELTGPFETTVEAEGRPLTVAFGAQTLQLPKLGSGLVLTLPVAAAFAVLAFALTVALTTRSQAAQQLEAVEASAEARLRAARTVERQRLQGRELVAAMERARPVGDVIDDLAWVASAKAPEARLAAVHWDHGLIAVEARGEAAPFAASDRLVERSDRPIRPGVWLWGVRATDDGRTAR